MRRSDSFPLLILLLLLSTASHVDAQLRGGPLAPQPRPQPTYRAEEFIDFMGINAAPFERYLDSGPFKGAGTRYPPEVLFDLGIRYYRTCLSNELSLSTSPQSLIAAWEKYGARPMFLIDPGKLRSPAEVVGLVKQYPREMIAEIEGPNEANNQFPPQTLNLKHKGKIDEAAAAAWMDDCYKVLKADPATADIPVVAFTAIFTDYRLARPHTSFDFGNMHPYQGYDVPSSTLEEGTTRFNNILPPDGLVKPFVPTECGYNIEEDKANANKSVGSRRAQALNIPMLFAEYFRHGIRRAYLFALHNGDGYGLLESDQQIKRPSYFAVKNLVSNLHDATWSAASHKWEGGRHFTPRALLFDLPGAPETIHTLALQKQSGEYSLLIWNELRNYDPAQRRDLVNPPVSVTINFLTPVGPEATILSQNDRGEYDVTTATVSNNRLTLGVPAAVTIIRLLPGAATPAVTPPTPVSFAATASENGMRLTWDSVPGASGYFVFRNDFHIATVTQPGYQDTSSWLRPDRRYSYAIQAYDTAGNMSPRATTAGTTRDQTPDLLVSGLTTEPAKPKPGDTVTFKCTLKNAGAGATPPGVQTGVSWYIDGRHAAWSTRPGPMKAGEEWVLASNGGGPAGNGQWIATPGHHVLKVLADDINRLPEEQSKANNAADQSLLVGPETRGLLLGASVYDPGQVDLANGASPGESLSFPADTTTRVLRVRVAGFEGVGGTLTAKLSDNSAPPFVSSSWNGNLSGFNWAAVPDSYSAVYTLRYHAASAGQKLTVDWKLTSDPNRSRGHVRLLSATLTLEIP